MLQPTPTVMKVRARRLALRTAEIVIVAAAYYVSAKLGLSLALVEGTVTPLWPPTGIALVAFLVFGVRVWPGVLVAAFLINAPLTPAPLAAIAMAVGNTLAPLVARGLLALARFRVQLDRTRDAVALVFLAALTAMLISATIGSAALLANDVITRGQFAETWWVWWAGDAMGVLAVAPFLLGLGQLRSRQRVRWWRVVEAGLLVSSVAGVSFLLQATSQPVWVLVFPVLGWAAWRFQQPAAAPAALSVIAVASWAAARNLGPFGGGTLLSDMAGLQVFNAAAAFTSVYFAAAVTERLRDRQALQRAAAEADEAVRRRTAELAQANERLEHEIIEREETERALRHREGQLAEAQRLSNLGSWEWDIATNRVTWSDELYRIYGLEPPAFTATYEGFLQRVHPADRARADALVRRALKDREPFSYEHRVLRPDGEERTVFATGRVISDDGGVAVRMVGTGQDITERSKTERALRESEEVFRTVFESAAIGLAQCDLDGCLQRTNAAFQRLIGYPSEALESMTLSELTHGKDRARFDDLFARMRKGEIGTVEIEQRLRRHDGGRVWIHAAVSLVRTIDDEPRFIQAVIRDLSERKRAEALQRAEDERARMRTLFSQVPAAVVVTSGAKHTVEFANESFMDLVRGRECVGVAMSEAFPELEEQGYLARLDEVFASGKPFLVTEAPLSLNGEGSNGLEQGFFNLTLQPLTTPDGETEGILWHSVDVSEAVRSRVQVAESLAFLDTLLANAPAGFAVFDDAMRCIRINDRLVKMTGLPPGTYVGRSLREVMPALADDVEPILRSVLERGKPITDVELNGPLTPDGETWHWLASYYPVTTPDGAILGAGSVVVDITERKRMEALLAGQKEALELVARGAHLSAVLEALAQLAEKQSRGDVLASILLLDADGKRLRHGAVGGLPADFAGLLDALPVAADSGSSGAAAATGEKVIVADIATHPNWESLRHLAIPHGLRAAWAAPIRAADGTMLGTVCMYCRQPRPPVPHELELLDVLVRTAAIAIERERVETERKDLAEREHQAQIELYQREHHIAETLQRSMLPEQLPQNPDVAVAARYIPASTQVDVGGDWYDIIPLPDGRIGVAIGDVAGHGVAAAAAMGQMRMALRAYALENLSPAESLARLNRLLTEFQPGAMATLAYAHLDPESGSLRMANAGHPPPLIVDADGGVRYLEGGLAPPIGVAVVLEYGEVEAHLGPGATAILYTDGLIERRGESFDEGMERLKDVARSAPPNLDDACDHIVNSLLEQERAADDVAVLVVRRVDLAGRPFTIRLPGHPGRLSSMRRVFGRWLRQNGLSHEDASEVVIACTEACTNAMQHAYGAGEGWLELDAEVQDRELRVKIRDFGSWRPSQSSDEGGRGMHLMRALMDSVEVVAGIEGTEIRMRRRARELVRDG